MLNQKFPEDIQCIMEPCEGKGGIYISNVEAAENPQTLARLKIQAVLTAVKGKNMDKTMPQHIEYLYVPAVDHESFDLSQFFEVSNQFIDTERKRTNVLVHCMAGISRSVTLVIAYMIKCLNKSFRESYTFVKGKRSIIHPNDSFLEQLRKYEQKMRMPLMAKAQNIQNSQVDQNSQNSKKIENDLKKKGELKNVDSRYVNNSFVAVRKGLQNEVRYDQNLKDSIKSIFTKRFGESRIL